ncbi:MULTISPECIES: hypothetical protein [Macrococcoides]|uniref:hypothetical protein n=1 Tax=Macrococcoides TaxID=3076173 RepID=UPI000C343DC6|nr:MULTISPECIES: hypothetical protein [Macrococcus]PKE18457.1 hypothetical protein CW679_10910 [Macrococcus caseolyticus]QNR09082.1 hypothetical protein GL258_12415 [Macrococcus canis]QYA36578.1 hypothetical protein KYI08_12140 [Macrococcus caseolyticus]
MKKVLMKIPILLIVMVLLGACSNTEKEKKKTENVDVKDVVTIVSEKALNYSYGKEEIDTKEVFSRKLNKQIEIQNQSYTDNTPIKREVEDIEIYLNKKNDVMYRILVNEINEKEKNIDKTERYGIIRVKVEDKKLKVNEIKELGFNAIAGDEW